MSIQKSGRTKTYIACAISLVACSAWADGRLHNLKAIQDGAAYQGFIVKYRDGSAEFTNSQALQTAITAAADKLKKANAVDISAKGNPVRPFGLEHVRRIATGGNLVHPSRNLSRDEGVAIMRQLAIGGNVEYVEPNLIHYPAVVPNDPMYSSQWGYGVNGIRAEQAWDKSTGTGIIVAVLDTGITSHPDLNANVVAGYDFVSDSANAADGNGRDANPADMGNSCSINWHGTHTAGTIAAVSNNSTGVAGVAYGAKVMPVRVLGKCGGTVADIADAIAWSSGGTVSGVTTLSAAATAKVISMSLGGKSSTCPASYQTAIDGAISRGTTVVAAAGNNNEETSNFSPANCNGVIAVAAVDSTGSRASFSNYGARVDVSAPGVDVLSTWNSGTTAEGTPTYTYMPGTSMATPHVAGTVALIQARRKAANLALYTPAEVTQVIKGMARPLPGTCTGGCGAGIVDAGASVAVALANSVPVGKMTDPTGRMTTVIFQRTAAAAASSFTDFQIDVPEDYAVVGGGVQGAENPVGHLLTASYPNAARSAWLVSTKDHLLSNPAQIVGWAIGMKINNMSRATLLSNLSYKEATSVSTSAPTTSVAMDYGYLLLGGGFKVGPNAAGNLAVLSYPQYSSQYRWTVQSKDHGTTSPATITAYGIGLKWTLSDGSSMTTSSNPSTVSPVTSHPAATAQLSSQYVITGCGALVNWSNPGNLLWKVKPVVSAGVATCDVASKDHYYTSPASIQGFAIGVKFN